MKRYVNKDLDRRIHQYRDGSKKMGGAPEAHRVEHVPYRLSPDRSNPGLNIARGPLLHVLLSISHTFLSISLYNKA